MDTITHGIAGALIGKAVFRGEDMFASRAHESRPHRHLVADARRDFSRFGHAPRLFLTQSDADSDVASQHHAFPGLHAAFRASCSPLSRGGSRAGANGMRLRSQH